MPKIWKNYQPDVFYDELIYSEYQPRASSYSLCQYLEMLTHDNIEQRKTAAELAIQEMGISFTVYSDEGNIDRAWPFDIIPRIIEAQEFINDGEIPSEIINSSINFLSA